MEGGAEQEIPAHTAKLPLCKVSIMKFLKSTKIAFNMETSGIDHGAEITQLSAAVIAKSAEVFNQCMHCIADGACHWLQVR